MKNMKIYSTGYMKIIVIGFLFTFRLRKSDIKIKFVTNTTKECKRVLVERLQGLGFDIEPEEIFTSLTAARCCVERRKLRPMLLLEDTAKEDFVGSSIC